MKSKFIVAGFIILVLLQIAPRAYEAIKQPSYPTSTLTIEAGGKTYPFKVEVARTEEQMEHGLMYRQSLAQDGGMLFIYPQPRLITMWMKNTLIPLDMVFMDADGKILTIAQNAKPETTNTISSLVPATAVLEINGGAAARLDLNPGDRVISEDLRHP
jgi:uncharacterized membrane protein (UPF0127 family)